MIAQSKRWYHFSLSALLLLQVRLSPVFLGPLYQRFESEELNIHPLAALAAIIIAPAAYAAVFSLSAVVGAQYAADKCKAGSVVLAAVRSGIISSAIFGVLVIGSLLVNWTWLGARARLEESGVYSSFTVSGITFFVAISFLYWLAIGAASGGIVGLVADKWRWNQPN
jgi:hypothetical protein